MRYKGDAPQAQAVRLAARPLVTELAEAPGAAPAFPLRARRPAAAAAARAGPGPAGAGSAPPDAAGGPGAGAASAPAAGTQGAAATGAGGGGRADERPPPARAAVYPEASMPSHAPAPAQLSLHFACISCGSSGELQLLCARLLAQPEGPRRMAPPQSLRTAAPAPRRRRRTMSSPMRGGRQWRCSSRCDWGPPPLPRAPAHARSPCAGGASVYARPGTRRSRWPRRWACGARAQACLQSWTRPPARCACGCRCARTPSSWSRRADRVDVLKSGCGTTMVC